MGRLSSPLFRVVAVGVCFLLNALALHLLLRGHHAPGGGFIAGLATAVSLLLLLLAEGLERTRQVLRVEPLHLAVAGLALALLTGLVPMVAGHPVLEHFWLRSAAHPQVPAVEVGTVLLFDVGVFLVVVGVMARLFLTLGRASDDEIALLPSEQADFASPDEEPIEAHPPPAGATTPKSPPQSHAA